MLSFNTRQEALAYIAANGLHAEPVGLRSDGKDRYEIRDVAAPVQRSAAGTPRIAAKSGAPTAKSICLSLYVPGQERDAFVKLAVAAGVKEVTARTMFSDIKAGRIR